MHNSRQHSVEKYRPAERDFNSAPDDLYGQRIEQDSGEQCQSEHQRKGQRHCAIKNQHWRDVDVRVIHPIERWNKVLRDLRHQHEHEQYSKENHLRPVTTKTSSRCERSTAGASFACPSSARILKSFTVPMNKPEGKTPPT